jgi:hypothetical protein
MKIQLHNGKVENRFQAIKSEVKNNPLMFHGSNGLIRARGLDLLNRIYAIQVVENRPLDAPFTFKRLPIPAFLARIHQFTKRQTAGVSNFETIKNNRSLAARE